METETTVRRTRGGNVNEGPERWKRARLNAEARPTSGGAKLYRRREKFAEELVQRFFAHQNQAFRVLRELGISGERNRALTVCSVRCLGFQLQLEVGNYQKTVGLTFDEYADLVRRALEAKGEVRTHTWTPRPGNTYAHTRTLKLQTVDRTRLDRSVTCRVCGAHVVGDKQTVRQIEKVTKDTTQYVLVNGVLTRVTDLLVVDLTARDFELLDGYSTPDLRQAYVNEYGHRFDG